MVCICPLYVCVYIYEVCNCIQLTDAECGLHPPSSYTCFFASLQNAVYECCLLLLAIYSCNCSIRFPLLICSVSLLMLDCYVECWMLQLAKLWLVQQSLIIQVAKKASVLKRRKSKNRMEVPSNALEGGSNSNRRESEGDVVFYIEEPKAGIVQLFAAVLLVGCDEV